jgi:hypothetical protein
MLIFLNQIACDLRASTRMVRSSIETASTVSDLPEIFKTLKLGGAERVRVESVPQLTAK